MRHDKAMVEKIDPQEIGRRLDRAIKANGMSYADFGRLIAAKEGPDSKIGSQTVFHWRRTGKISRARLMMICEVLGIPLEDLLYDHTTKIVGINGKEVTLSHVDMVRARKMMSKASPKSQSKLQDIIHKAESGQLDEQDVDTLHQIAERLASKVPADDR